MRNIPFGYPWIGDEEKNAVQEVLSGPILTHGPRVKEFEAAFAEYTGARHAVATASCTASLHLSYFYLNIGPGDEVIVPAQTHVATAHAVELCGGRPVFVDAEPRTGNIDIDRIEEAVTEHTRALSVVHYLGMPVDMDRVNAIARKHNLFVVEDCALALGTFYKGKHAGTLGDVGCFSFYPVKHITTAEGGMLTAMREDVADSISRQRAFGIDRNVVSERKIPGMYDVQGLGFNYRLNEIGAALGIQQMKRVPEILRRRKRNYEILETALRDASEIELFQSTNGDCQSSYYCFCLILKEPLHLRRYELMEWLKQKGVGTSIYYPQAVPAMSYYQTKYGYTESRCPVAARISNHCIALPVGPHVTEEDATYIAEQVKEGLREIR